MKKTSLLCPVWILFLAVFSSLVQATPSVQIEQQGVKQHEMKQGEVKQIVDVGVLAIRGHLYAEQRWQPTIDWLNKQISEVHFVLHPLNLDEMGEAVKFQTMDFIVTNPGQAVRLGRQYALSWMATLTSRAPQNSNYGIGSALVVRANSPYQTLKEVSGLPVAAVAEKAFGGYLTLRYQIVEMGLDPNDFFADVRFLGFPIDANLYQLRDGNVEAAVVPACLLEKMQDEGLLQQGGFRVLNQQPHEHSSCAVSTPLYPNWSFAKTERGSSLLAKKVAQVLLSMPPEHPAIIAAGASGWTSPVSLLSIDKLYQALDLHPLQQPWWQEALRWLRNHQEWAWALFIFVIVLNAYHFWLEYRFSKSKQALEQTSLRLKEKSEQLEHSQRVAIVGEIGSSLAHELNQPLAAIRNYSEGGLLRLAKKRPYEDIVPVFDKIQGQVERADAIIQRLRTLIRKRSVDKAPCDIQALIDDTVELLHFRLQKQNVSVVTSSEGEVRHILADVVGVQQVLVNVINNAIDACALFQEKYHSSGYQGKIALHSDYQGHQLSIRVLDNGTGLQQENPTQAFVSTKEEGLGLGLAICRDVMELHGGEFLIRSTTPHGCLVELVFPYQE
ncbi:PhnD/SsuA/transferrin family substrate-binding protein [Vibrio natriegens]|uniref:sensor histidine kinase n=1 Tax=Vibrio natriegens TaxID=691 RepID=UPI002283AB1D|nr:sensor histidine kinase [Vibrio natriegens]MCY9875777.1 PhnD/SsuA/transferrin family substrate-binding protein [Vibrio natriegens]